MIAQEFQALTFAGMLLTPIRRRVRHCPLAWSKIETVPAATHEHESRAQRQTNSFFKALYLRLVEVRPGAGGGNIWDDADWGTILPGAMWLNRPWMLNPAITTPAQFARARVAIWEALALLNAHDLPEGNMPIELVDMLYERPTWADNYADWGWAHDIAGVSYNGPQVTMIAIILAWYRDGGALDLTGENWHQQAELWLFQGTDYPFGGVPGVSAQTLVDWMLRGLFDFRAIMTALGAMMLTTPWTHNGLPSTQFSVSMASVFHYLQSVPEWSTDRVRVGGRAPDVVWVELRSSSQFVGEAYVPIGMMPIASPIWSVFLRSQYKVDLGSAGASLTIAPDATRTPEPITLWMVLAAKDDQIISVPSKRMSANLTYIGGPPGRAWTSGTLSKQQATQLAANTIHKPILDALNLRFPTEVLGGQTTGVRVPNTTKAGGPYRIPPELLNGTKFIGEVVAPPAGRPEDDNSPIFWVPLIAPQRMPGTFLMVYEGLTISSGIATYIEAKPAPFPAGGSLLYIPGRMGLPGGGNLNVFSGNGGQIEDATPNSQNPTGRANFVSRRGLVEAGEFYCPIPKEAVPLMVYGEPDTTENGSYGCHSLLRCSDEGPLAQPFAYSVVDMAQYIGHSGLRGFYGVVPVSGLIEGRQIQQYVAYTDSTAQWQRTFVPLFPMAAGGLVSSELEQEDDFAKTLQGDSVDDHLPGH
jgi:hypothetical protein